MTEAIDCPVCRAPLRETLHEGVLIDICTRCLGVWLDRGEFEMFVRRDHADGKGPATAEPGRR